MKYCRNCGSQVLDEAVVCVKCGSSQGDIKVNNDKGGFWWGLLGFVAPLAGLVLFLVFKDDKPGISKSCGIGALVGAILGWGGFFLIGGLSMLLLFSSLFWFF